MKKSILRKLIKEEILKEYNSNPNLNLKYIQDTNVNIKPKGIVLDISYNDDIDIQDILMGGDSEIVLNVIKGVDIKQLTKLNPNTIVEGDDNVEIVISDIELDLGEHISKELDTIMSLNIKSLKENISQQIGKLKYDISNNIDKYLSFSTQIMLDKLNKLTMGEK